MKKLIDDKCCYNCQFFIMPKCTNKKRLREFFENNMFSYHCEDYKKQEKKAGE